MRPLPSLRWLPLALALACDGGDDGGDGLDPTDSATDTSETGTDAALFADAGPDLVLQVGQEHTFEAGPETTEGTLVWDWGDGSSGSGWTTVKIWREPGNYRVLLQVTTLTGERVTDEARVTVHRRLAGPPTYHASALTRDAATGDLWVVVPEADLVSVIGSDGAVKARIPVCDNPRTIAVGPTRAAVTCEDDDGLGILDKTSRTFLRTVDLGRGTRPYGVVPEGSEWWVTLQGTGFVALVNNTEVVERINYGYHPRGLAKPPLGPVIATRFRSSSTFGEILRSAPNIQLQPDPGPDSDTDHRGIPNLLHDVVASPDGDFAYVAGINSNTFRGLWRERLEPGGPRPLTFESTVRGTIRTVFLRDGVELPDDQKSFDNHGDVRALALTPLGNWLWAAHQGTQIIHKLDAYTFEIAGSISNAGAGIDAMTLSDDGGILYVHAWLDREVRAYDVSDPVATPELLWTAATVDGEPLAPAVLLGKKLFHDSADPRLARDGYVHCATCHPDGRDDGMTWDFTDRGEGLRNTISLEGRGGMGHGNLHWTGNFDEVQDFENDIRHAQAGSGLLAPADWAATEAPFGAAKAGRSADLDALAAYVSSLTRLHPSPFTEPSTGATLFVDKGCDDCHDPASDYTDSQVGTSSPRHDIGTIDDASGQRLGGALDGFDTPTLLGAWETGPYLHDGTAPSIENAIGQHELETFLTDFERGEIADFVRTLGGPAD